MRTRWNTVLILAGVLSGSGVPAGAADTTPRGNFALPDTRVIDLPRAGNGIDYQLYVYVPPECYAAGADCPAVYMLDAEYSFGLAVVMAGHLHARQQLPALAFVAIGYPDKSRYRYNRTRDYTPFHYPDGGYGKEMQKVSGGGPAFLAAMRADIVPYVEQHFPVSRDARTLVGHSYGGLFATYAWLTAPDLFTRYILVSPSLWYANRQPLRAVAEECRESGTAPATTLYLAVGDHEEQPQNGHAMVSDLRQLERLLDGCATRDVGTELRVFEDETHASIFPTALSSALRTLF